MHTRTKEGSQPDHSQVKAYTEDIRTPLIQRWNEMHSNAGHHAELQEFEDSESLRLHPCSDFEHICIQDLKQGSQP